MSGAELPPPYSLADEPNANQTLQPGSAHLTPSASRQSLRPGPTEPGFYPSPNPSSIIPPSVSASVPTTSNGSPSTLPPSYLGLTTFGVGKKLEKPLVTIEQIKSHLKLLRAFKLFQEKVEDPYSDPEVADVVPPIGRSVGTKGRWLWFLEMAVERSVFRF